MRLTSKEVVTIKETVKTHLNNATIYLFGSRVDDSKKGGDIDLYIISDKATYEIKIKILAKLEMLLQKPVDIVLHKDFTKPIEQEALKGIQL